MGVTTGAQIQINGSARNAGGVKSFTISIRQANRVVFRAMAAAAPDATGMVPDLLSILGTDGAGRPGNMPMVVTMREPVQATSTALNFNGMAKSTTVNYLPVSIVVVGGGGPPPGETDTTARLLLPSTMYSDRFRPRPACGPLSRASDLERHAAIPYRIDGKRNAVYTAR